jgi:membrane protein YqaA with SNARE-associated domain
MDDNGRRMLTNRRLAWLVVVALLAALVMLFVADNFVLIEVRFFNRGIQMRLAWAMIIPLLLGGSIGYLWGRLRR